MNWKGCERKLSWTNLRHYHDIFLEGIGKTTENPSWNSRCPGPYSNRRPPEYISEALPLRQHLNGVNLWLTIRTINWSQRARGLRRVISSTAPTVISWVPVGESIFIHGFPVSLLLYVSGIFAEGRGVIWIILQTSLSFMLSGIYFELEQDRDSNTQTRKKRNK
jgi:hypothetical protein